MGKGEKFNEGIPVSNPSKDDYVVSAKEKAERQAEVVKLEGEKMISKQIPIKSKELKNVAKKVGSATGAIGAAKALDFWKPKDLKGQVAKGAIQAAAGIAANFGLSKKIEEGLEKITPDFAGDKQLTQKTLNLIEKGVITRATLKAATALEAGALKEVAQINGLKTLSKVLSRQVESKVLRKIHEYAGKSFLKKIGASLGLRGAILAGTLADDTTVIGVLDDFVAAGMAVWMSKDIYDLIVLSRKIIKINSEMEKLPPMTEGNIAGADEVSKKLIENSLEISGKTLQEMSEEELDTFIKSFPELKFEVTWPNRKGKVIYRYVKGEIFSTTMHTESGEVLELDDEELNQDIALPAPPEFEKWEIDYSLTSKELQANYRLALLYTKSECSWTKLDFKILNDNEILVKRLDGDQEEITIKRTGKTWSVNGYSEGKDLFQAIALANLINKVKGLLKKNGEMGGSERPFYEDNWNIMFDRKNNIWNNLDILSGTQSWLPFYGKKIGVDKYEVIETLNNWYQKEKLYL